MRNRFFILLTAVLLFFFLAFIFTERTSSPEPVVNADSSYSYFERLALDQDSMNNNWVADSIEYENGIHHQDQP